MNLLQFGVKDTTYLIRNRLGPNEPKAPLGNGTESRRINDKLLFQGRGQQGGHTGKRDHVFNILTTQAIFPQKPIQQPVLVDCATSSSTNIDRAAWNSGIEFWH